MSELIDKNLSKFMEGKNMTTKVMLDKMEKNAKNGKVGKIAKAVGDSVKRGEKLMQIESAKGNTIIKSKVNGTITAFAVTEGARVKVGDELLEIEKAE
jgi:pyruvate/2-oxoglutarate dehydrogenase complex dihydrolipoamide acyltransferase (E2) component